MEKFKHQQMSYTVPEVAELLHIGKNKAYQLVNTEGFPSVRLGGRIIVPAEMLTLWLNDQTKGQ